MLIPIAVALAILFFFYQMAMFILKDGDEKEKHKTKMLWGVIAIAVMVSIWGLVSVLQNVFGVGEESAGTINTPRVNVQGSSN